MADVGQQAAAADVGMLHLLYRLGQLPGAAVYQRLELLALLRLPLTVHVEFGRQQIQAARHF